MGERDAAGQAITIGHAVDVKIGTRGAQVFHAQIESGIRHAAIERSANRQSAGGICEYGQSARV